MYKKLLVEMLVACYEIVEEGNVIQRIKKGDIILINSKKLGIREEIYDLFTNLELEDDKRLRKYFYNELTRKLTKLYMAA